MHGAVSTQSSTIHHILGQQIPYLNGGGTTLIGWHQLLLGYSTSKMWLLFAYMDLINTKKINLSAGRTSKTYTALKALTLLI
jgi:hypothetical protein